MQIRNIVYILFFPLYFARSTLSQTPLLVVHEEMSFLTQWVSIDKTSVYLHLAAKVQCIPLLKLRRCASTWFELRYFVQITLPFSYRNKYSPNDRKKGTAGLIILLGFFDIPKNFCMKKGKTQGERFLSIFYDVENVKLNDEAWCSHRVSE